jgi:hypothetical protein
MRKIKITLFIVVVIALFTTTTLLLQKAENLKTCIVTGDVKQNVLLEDLEVDLYNKINMDKDRVEAILVHDIIQQSQPLSDEFSVLFVGHDGLFAQLNGNELKDCYIIKSKGRWDIKAPNHPVNANIKDLKEIIVVDESGELEIGINIISQEKNIFHTTPGNLMLEELTYYPYLDGETNINGENSISLYKYKKVIALKDIITEEEVKTILVMGKNGEYEYFTEPGYLELSKNAINYMEPQNRDIIQDIAGVIINPPSSSIMDTYEDSLYYLGKNEKVMVIYVDGFGYHQYKYAKENNKIPFIENMGEALRVNTVYKPVTNAGYAAMVTGQPPIKNGVVDRSFREPKVNTIFDELKDKNHVLIESNGSILSLNTETIFSIDNNDNGTTDDEIFENTIIQLQENKDLDFILVHFHGLDDAGHQFGDLDERTIEVLIKTDQYIEKIVDKWDGKVILVSDHGMHSSGEQGNHGDFRYEDMFVPYIIKN